MFRFVFDGIGNTDIRTKCWLPAYSSIPTMFSKDFFFGVNKSEIVWLTYCLDMCKFQEFADKIKCSSKQQNLPLTLSQTSPFFTCPQFKYSENTVGKGEIAHHEQFLLFPQCFLPVWRTFYHFHQV